MPRQRPPKDTPAMRQPVPAVSRACARVLLRRLQGVQSALDRGGRSGSRHRRLVLAVPAGVLRRRVRAGAGPAGVARCGDCGSGRRPSAGSTGLAWRLGAVGDDRHRAGLDRLSSYRHRPRGSRGCGHDATRRSRSPANSGGGRCEYRRSAAQPQRSTTANEIYISGRRAGALELQSHDVIHSFWVPNLHGKMDLIPGRTRRDLAPGRRAGRLSRPVRRVLRPPARAHGARSSSPSRSDDFAALAGERSAQPAADAGDRWPAARAARCS